MILALLLVFGVISNISVSYAYNSQNDIYIKTVKEFEEYKEQKDNEIEDIMEDKQSMENILSLYRNLFKFLKPFYDATNVEMQELFEYIRDLEIENGQKSLEERIQNSHTMTKNHYISDTCDFEYWLYNPNLYSNEKMPLIVSLHGGNGTGRNLDQLVNYDEGFCTYLYEGKTFPNAIVLMPQSPTGWTRDYDDLMELIEYIVKEYDINRSRIYITGVSRGGVATYEMLKLYPNYFAAAMPIASATYPYTCKDIKTPMRIYHGEYDLRNTGGTVSMGDSVIAVEKLINENGGNCELFILPGVGHSGQFIYWDTENYDAMEWLLSQVNSNVIEDINDNVSVEEISFGYFTEDVYQDENTYSSPNVYVQYNK